jgi:hypothetical protein
VPSQPTEQDVAEYWLSLSNDDRDALLDSLSGMLHPKRPGSPPPANSPHHGGHQSHPWSETI